MNIKNTLSALASRKSRRFWRRLKNFILKLITGTAVLSLFLLACCEYTTTTSFITALVVLLLSGGWIAIFLAANPQYCEPQEEKEERGITKGEIEYDH